MHKRRRHTTQERFFRHVQKTDTCWIWIGAKYSNGYGIFMVSPERPVKTTTAHRVSWMIHHGPIPIGMDVCHTCDIRPCVNPSHLWIGTRKENMQDMVKKGRQKTTGPNGEHNSHAKLQEQQVRDIRSRHHDGSITQAQLAREYGVSKCQISKIVLGQSWKHIIQR